MTIVWKNQSIILIRILLILLGLCFCLILLGLLFFWWIQPRYVFYTGEKQQWREIRLSFPNIRMGDGITFQVLWEPLRGASKEEVQAFINEYYNGDRSRFYSEFDRSIEVVQTRKGKQKWVPVLSDENGRSFGLINVPDEAYKDNTDIAIRMNEPMRSKPIPGDIILWKYMK